MGYIYTYAGPSLVILSLYLSNSLCITSWCLFFPSQLQLFVFGLFIISNAWLMQSSFMQQDGTDSDWRCVNHKLAALRWASIDTIFAQAAVNEQQRKHARDQHCCSCILTAWIPPPSITSHSSYSCRRRGPPSFDVGQFFTTPPAFIYTIASQTPQ